MKMLCVIGGVVGMGLLASCSSSPSPTQGTQDAAVQDVPNPNDVVVPQDTSSPQDSGAADASSCLDARAPAALTRIATGAGSNVALALDDHNDPAVAYFEGLNVRFQRWDRCLARWRAAVTIDTVTDADTSSFVRQISIAFDRTTGRFGVAYIKTVLIEPPNGTHTVVRALSTDGGLTWPDIVRASDHATAGGATNPMIAFAGATTWMAWIQGSEPCSTRPGETCTGMVFFNGATRSVVNVARGEARETSASIATDSAGGVGVAFYTLEGSYNSVAYFARPGMPAVQVLDSNNVQNDNPAIGLSFDGTDPRVSLIMNRTMGGGAVNSLFFVRSSNGGAMWDAPVTLPRDGDDSVDGFTALATHGAHYAVGTASNSGSDTPGTCGVPKIYRSQNGTVWSCAPGLGRRLGGDALGLAYDSGDHLHAVFYTTPTHTPDDGLYYYHD